ncbi:MAG: hypothetical protein Q7S57_03500 [bacterium]|nr:hypothetical protein [bacterium]
MDNNALLKAIGIGIGVFVVMMLIFWGIAKYSGMEILNFPTRTPAVQVTAQPTTPPFLQ